MTNELGIDRSGNNNTWTVNNMTLAADQMLDSPTNIFATLNPLDQWTGGTLSEGNLKIVLSGGNYYYYPTFGVSTGKWYWEVQISTVGVRNNLGVFSHQNSSLKKLIQIYEYTCEWDKALSTTEKLNKIDPSNDYKKNIPQYLCQISEKYISQNNLKKAEQYTDQAKATKSKSSRIIFISTQIALKKENQAEAIELYKKLCEFSDLGHQILLPDLINLAKAKKNEYQLILSMTNLGSM